ncbi:hypothetical protein HXX76_010988 [Chlamydomonas incerta]|uniref:protein-serine/threonine phosphatase n=1 Tax=Chlamydomonas incerta TaxID=51695 RepID=A0A835SLE1_CHLIN|nr:hypothetical protein HXX76_010988 [Chlamydomonas incerta]|eukprot:KAG2429218.1 hypothetical protein HXX76_010988 [Chlamydomonas incerta]
MAGPLLSEDGELEDGEVQTEGAAEAEESGEASGCEGEADEVENGSAAGQDTAGAAPKSHGSLPPPPHLQPSGLPLAPSRSGRLQDSHVSGSGTGTSPAPGAKETAGAGAAGGKDDREVEELQTLLRDLTRNSSFQDVMRSLETVCRDLKQAIKKLDKLFRRVKKRKGDSIEDYPDCFQYSRRILEGLHTVNKFSQTSAYLAAPAAGADAARALFKAAMNYRHDIFNAALKAELETLVRNSKAFKVVLENRRGGPPPAAAAGGTPAPSGLGAEATARGAKASSSVQQHSQQAAGAGAGTGTGADSKSTGSEQRGDAAGAGAAGEELPPLPSGQGEAGAQPMDTDAQAPPPPPNTHWRSPSPSPGPDGVPPPGPPPPDGWPPAPKHTPGPGSGGGAAGAIARSSLQGRAASSLMGPGGGGSAFKLKIVVASTPGDLRAAAAAAAAATSTGHEAEGDEPPAKRIRGAPEGEAGGLRPSDTADGAWLKREEGEGGPQGPVLGGAEDGGALPPPPESPVSDAGAAGGGDDAMDTAAGAGTGAAQVPQPQQPQPSHSQRPGSKSKDAQDDTAGGSGSHRERERSSRDKDRDKERDKDRERERDRDKERDRDRDRDRHRSSKDKDKDKERDKERDKEHGSSHRSSRHRDRDRDAAAAHVKSEAATGGDTGPSASAQRLAAAAAGLSDDQAAVVSSCLGRGRLVLVVDLDGVLADSCWDAQLDGPTAAALVRRAAVEAAALPEDRRELFRLPLEGGALWLKLRPGARAFLARAAERYELWARTRQGRPYADAVVELLDPHQQLFGSRVVAAGVLAKRLLAALECRAPIATVLDTPDAAWMGEPLSGSLLALPPYAYFAVRPCAPGGAVAASGMAGRCMLEVDRDEDAERGALAAALPLLEALHGRVLHAYAGSGSGASANGGTGGGSGAAPPSPAAGGPLLAAATHSSGPALEPWDVRRVLRELRERILAGTHITFSRVFSGGAAAGPQHPLWRLAEACGATVSAACSDSTTHVVSLSGATEKALWAQQHGRFVVYPSWLECSCYTWRKVALDDTSIVPMRLGSGGRLRFGTNQGRQQGWRKLFPSQSDLAVQAYEDARTRHYPVVDLWLHDGLRGWALVQLRLVHDSNGCYVLRCPPGGDTHALGLDEDDSLGLLALEPGGCVMAIAACIPAGQLKTVGLLCGAGGGAVPAAAAVVTAGRASLPPPPPAFAAAFSVSQARQADGSVGILEVSLPPLPGAGAGGEAVGMWEPADQQQMTLLYVHMQPQPNPDSSRPKPVDMPLARFPVTWQRRGGSGGDGGGGGGGGGSRAQLGDLLPALLQQLPPQGRLLVLPELGLVVLVAPAAPEAVAAAAAALTAKRQRRRQEASTAAGSGSAANSDAPSASSAASADISGTVTRSSPSGRWTASPPDSPPPLAHFTVGGPVEGDSLGELLQLVAEDLAQWHPVLQAWGWTQPPKQPQQQWQPVEAYQAQLVPTPTTSIRKPTVRLQWAHVPMSLLDAEPGAAGGAEAGGATSGASASASPVLCCRRDTLEALGLRPGGRRALHAAEPSYVVLVAPPSPEGAAVAAQQPPGPEPVLLSWNKKLCVKINLRGGKADWTPLFPGEAPLARGDGGQDPVRQDVALWAPPQLAPIPAAARDPRSPASLHFSLALNFLAPAAAVCGMCGGGV